MSKKMGRPLQSDSPKRVHSVRLTEKELKRIREIFGTLSNAIAAILREDEEFNKKKENKK